MPLLPKYQVNGHARNPSLDTHNTEIKEPVHAKCLLFLSFPQLHPGSLVPLGATGSNGSCANSAEPAPELQQVPSSLCVQEFNTCKLSIKKKIFLIYSILILKSYKISKMPVVLWRLALSKFGRMHIKMGSRLLSCLPK